MTPDQAQIQNKFDTKSEHRNQNTLPPSEGIKSSARAIREDNELANLQKELNSAAIDNCGKAVTACISACTGVNEDVVEECTHDKKNIELMKKQLESISTVPPEKLKEIERIEDATSAMPEK